MEPTTDIPVVSGQAYTVTEVDGRRPESLDDFTGDIYLTLIRSDQEFRVTGSGSAPTADSVRFYQKDLALHDRDIRVWTITESGDSQFSAAPYAAF
jgi:hypothetical protein